MRLVRGRVAGPVVREAFAHPPSSLPGTLARIDLVVAMHHPHPSHRTHILIVPRRALRNLMSLRPEGAPLLMDVMAVAQELVREIGPEAVDYRLAVSGGPYQEVGQLHFHLISDGVPPKREPLEPAPGDEAGSA